ncbi:MAG: EVE domain-containing protein [Thiotrichales bacterium]|nr:MAG: EVE domain-containing protein [Thiotrichales bacterium]
MYWLMKSEPNEYSIDDLYNDKEQTEFWDGVRNYQVRNMMRDQMKVDELAFFYHSSCQQPGIVGIVKIAKAAAPDPTAFDPENKHYDPKSEKSNPRWFGVTVKFVEKFNKIIPLERIRDLHAFSQSQLVRKGNRLSIVPIIEQQWQAIMELPDIHNTSK